MRYYLDQRIKFWLAMMGVITLLYVQFAGNKGRLIKKSHGSSTERSSKPTRLIAVHIPDDSNRDEATAVTRMSSMEAYAQSIGADYMLLRENWSKELSQRVELYPDGVFLLDGTTIQKPTFELPLELLADGGKQTRPCTRVIALRFTSSDRSLLISKCGQPSVEKPNGRAFEQCLQAKPEAAICSKT